MFSISSLDINLNGNAFVALIMVVLFLSLVLIALTVFNVVVFNDISFTLSGLEIAGESSCVTCLGGG